MNFLWLEDFLVLAASGNFSRAADERHMTQPAFSRRIRALEDWLGTDLIDRRTQPATLTEAGQWFRAEAQAVLARVRRLPEEALAVADASAATLRIACTHALSLSFLPAWLRGLEAHTPIGPVQLVSDVLQHCENLLRQQRVQFLLCHAAEGALRPPFPSVMVGQDRLLPLSAPDRQGEPRHTLDGEAGGRARVPLLAYSAESGLGRLVHTLRGEALARQRTRVVFTAHLATVLKSMALDGRGVAWLPASLVADDLAAGRLVPAGGADWAIDVAVRLLRQPGPMPPAAEALWRAASGTGH